MAEVLVAGGVVALLFALRLANERLDPETLLRASAALIAAGFLLGLPASAVYHVRLGRALARAGRREARWWLHPTARHAALPPGERRRVLRWFRAGAAGFFLAVAGCALLLVLALRVAF